ncbi:MAG: AIR synthase family protein [Thermaerobacterales bacterium]
MTGIPGKLPPELLEQYVLGRRGRVRPEVLVPAAFGEDAAVLDLDGRLCVVSVDPITGSASEIGGLAVHVSCNDVAAHGAEPVAVLLCILVPPDQGAAAVNQIMAAAEQAALDLDVQIAGGHTEMTPGLHQPIVTATAIGAARRGGYLTSAALKPGHRLLMTKTAGLEGTAILAWDYGDRLRASLGEETVAEGRSLAGSLSVVSEALLAARSGAVAMHDATEGGVYGAVWEMAAAAGVGVEIWPDRIPVAASTRQICETLNVDPFRLISSGVLLIGVPAAAESSLVSSLTAAGHQVTAIGQALPAGAGCMIASAAGRTVLEPPASDELWRIKGELG